MESESPVFTKVILAEGQGAQPKNEQEVRINFKMHYITGQLICESSQPHRIVLGRGDTLKALQQALLQMKVGEKSKVTINASAIEDTKFQKGKDIIVEVELLSSSNVLPADKYLRLADRENSAKQCKQIGNEKIKKKQYEDAIEKYQEGYALVQFDTSDSAEQIKLSLLSNLSQAYLGATQYQKAIEACTKVLEDHPSNVKILYRRANGYRWLGKFDEALKDIEIGQKANPQSTELSSLLEEIKKQRQDAKKKEKAVYGRMFS